MPNFNVTAEQATKLHQLWDRHRNYNDPDYPTFGAFVATFLPVSTVNGKRDAIGGHVAYRNGGGIFICILPDGSAHS